MRKGIGRHLLGIVDAASDNGLVRIAFQEVDNHLLADARNADRTPPLAGPWMRHTNPARAVLIPLPLAVPVELHLDASILVRIDFFPGRPYRNGRLRAMHYWMRGDTGRAK